MCVRNKYNVSTGCIFAKELHAKDSRLCFPFLLQQELGELRKITAERGDMVLM